uniref:Uncharacterized protein n=1 Tax=Romanomermis culicivorax TaxID=13658 RepID=A0A915IGZ7_ROMCU
MNGSARKPCNANILIFLSRRTVAWSINRALDRYDQKRKYFTMLSFKKTASTKNPTSTTNQLKHNPTPIKYCLYVNFGVIKLIR